MKKTIVTVDFDGVLSRPEIQEKVCLLLTYCNIDLYVLTSRYDNLNKHRYPKNATNEDLFCITNALKIPPTKVLFTNGKKKGKYLQNTNVEYHFDDDYSEVRSIRRLTNIKAFHVTDVYSVRFFDWMLDNL